jgi:hypothetical protein
MEPFLNAAGIRNDIIIREENQKLFGLFELVGSTNGTNLFTRGDLVLFMPPGLYDVDREATRWLLKHEIAHIKHEDLLSCRLVTIISATAISILGMNFTSIPVTTILSFCASNFIKTYFTLWRDTVADTFAIERSSNEELLGGRRLLKAYQQTNLEREGFMKEALTNANGDLKFDQTHPSFKNRIQKIEAALRQRNLVINNEEEDPKIEVLKNFFKHGSRAE